MKRRLIPRFDGFIANRLFEWTYSLRIVSKLIFETTDLRAIRYERRDRCC
jgi:hypothetical protein